MATEELRITHRRPRVPPRQYALTVLALDQRLVDRDPYYFGVWLSLIEEQ